MSFSPYFSLFPHFSLFLLISHFFPRTGEKGEIRENCKMWRKGGKWGKSENGGEKYFEQKNTDYSSIILLQAMN